MIKQVLFISLLSFMTQLDGSMLLTALPRIAEDLDVSAIQLGFAMTVFYMMHAIALPICGWLVDKIGSKKACITALLSFTVISLMTAMATSYEVFTLCRCLQGANAALMIIGGRNALLEISTPENRLQLMTIASMPMLLAPTLGPPLGGLIVTYGHWSMIYLINASFAIVSAGILLYMLPKSESHQPRQFDVSGFILISVSITAFLLAFETLGLSRSQLVMSIILLLLAAASLWWSFRTSQEKEKPIINYRIFYIKTFRISTIGGGMWSRVAFRGLSFILIILLQISLGYSPLQSSLMVLMVDAGDLLTKPFVTKTINRYGYRNALVFGAVFSAVTIFVISFINSGTSIPVILMLFFIAGVTRGMLLSGTTGLAYANIDRPDFSQASVAASVSIQVGNALSISLVSLVLAVSAQLMGLSDDTHTGLLECRYALWLLSGISFLTALSFRRISHTVLKNA